MLSPRQVNKRLYPFDSCYEKHAVSAYLSTFPFLTVGLEKEALKAVYQMKIIAPNKSLLNASSRLS